MINLFLWLQRTRAQHGSLRLAVFSCCQPVGSLKLLRILCCLTNRYMVHGKFNSAQTVALTLARICSCSALDCPAVAAVPSQERLWHILTAILEGRPSHTFTDGGNSKGLPQKRLAHKVECWGKLIAVLMTSPTATAEKWLRYPIPGELQQPLFLTLMQPLVPPLTTALPAWRLASLCWRCKPAPL